ncbi:MAG TPA: hypothetical protein VIE38_10685 [Gaiellaceae bacterium]
MRPFAVLAVLLAFLVVVPASTGDNHGTLENAISGLETAIESEQHAKELESRSPEAATESLRSAARELARVYKELESVDLVSADAPVLSDIARAEKIDEEKDLHDGRLVKQVDLAISLKKRAVGALEELTGASAIAPFKIGRIRAVFDPKKFETTYKVDWSRWKFEGTLPKLTASWTLKITCIDSGCGTKQGTDANPAPNEDPGCDNAGVGVSKPFEQVLAALEPMTDEPPFIWHHPSPGIIPPYTCDHSKQGPSGHQGLITLKVTGAGWTCTEQLGGTESYDPNEASVQAAEARKSTAPVCSK